MRTVHPTVAGPANARPRARAFTLVEILIVVIILGILAAIVIPQFTNASDDARRSSLGSTLNTLRGQIELYVLQHGNERPPLTGADWSPLTTRTTFNGQPCGPYMNQAPLNPLNGLSDVLVVSADVNGGDAVSTPNIGFVFNEVNGKIWGTNKAANRIYNEANPKDPLNFN